MRLLFNYANNPDATGWSNKRHERIHVPQYQRSAAISVCTVNVLHIIIGCLSLDQQGQSLRTLLVSRQEGILTNSVNLDLMIDGDGFGSFTNYFCYLGMNSSNPSGDADITRRLQQVFIEFRLLRSSITVIGDCSAFFNIQRQCCFFMGINRCTFYLLDCLTERERRNIAINSAPTFQQMDAVAGNDRH